MGNSPIPLVFVELLFSQLTSEKDKQKKTSSTFEVSTKIPKFVSSILLAHTGSILKFHLAVPRYLPLYQCQYMIF